jgi:2-methylaconitate cis-trans-isomerase PrpF
MMILMLRWREGVPQEEEGVQVGFVEAAAAWDHHALPTAGMMGIEGGGEGGGAGSSRVQVGLPVKVTGALCFGATGVCHDDQTSC